MENKINKILNKLDFRTNKDVIKNKLLSGEKMIIKFGADPSRPDLHLGHTIPLRTLRNLQELGHDIVFIIGDFTGMIGDPTGKSKTRPSLTYKEVKENASTYFDQVSKILDMKKTRVLFNSEWLSKLRVEEILNLASKYTIAKLLERDDFKNRYNSNIPIGTHEFFYPLLQGYDSVVLKSDIELGGTDQLFNLLVGRELQKAYNQNQQEIMLFPLLVGLDGVNKMSKSLGNFISISDSAEVMYEKIMKIPDYLLQDYFKLTTDLETEEINQILSNDIVEAHKKYAFEIIKMYHNEKKYVDAELRYKQISSGCIPDSIECFFISKNDIEKGIRIIDLIYKVEFSKSKSEAIRLINQNAISINNERMNNIDKIIKLDDFKDKELVIKKGKNKFLKLCLTNKEV